MLFVTLYIFVTYVFSREAQLGDAGKGSLNVRWREEKKRLKSVFYFLFQ